MTDAAITHRLLITAHTALAFPLRKTGTQFTPSLPYIPGSALWGALGAQIDGTPPVRFSNALPAHPDDAWVRVLPATAMSCKLQCGFRADSIPGESRQHGVFDTLFEQMCVKELRPASLAYDPRCPVCLGKAERFDGFYAQWGNKCDWHARTVQRRIFTRIAIDRKLGTAAEGLLYSPIVISELNEFHHDTVQRYRPTTFVAQVWGLDDDLQANLERVPRVGAHISSGLGQVTVRATPVDTSDDMLERVEAFQTRLHECWRVFEQLQPQIPGPTWSPNDWQVFSIDLQNDALLHEHGWQPTAIYSAAQLAAQTGLAAEPVFAAATARVVGGWNVRWNRPKPTYIGAAAGSVYVFRTQASRDDISAALRQLEAEGIGERRAEGFGVVLGCDPFHTQEQSDE
jgi:CRISPR-associated protein Csx10